MMIDSMMIPPEMCAKSLALEIVSEKDNIKNRTMVMESWNLGPAETAGDNSEYWNKLAEATQKEVEEVKRNLCANCEYFNNTPQMLKAMEEIPEDGMDADGGGRGYCHKFDFICHNLRTCQAWEKKFYHIPHKGEY